MKKYYALINGGKVEVTKDVHDVLDGNTGEFRRERYLSNEVRQKNEVSFERLRECEYPIETHVLIKPQTTEDVILQKETKGGLYIAIKSLDDLEQSVIFDFYYEQKTDAQIALKHTVSRQYINKIRLRALNKLKNIIIINFI